MRISDWSSDVCSSDFRPRSTAIAGAIAGTAKSVMVAQAWTAKVARTGTSGSVAIASVKVSCGGRLSDHFGSYRPCPAECWPTQGSEHGLTGNPTFAGFYERRNRTSVV